MSPPPIPPRPDRRKRDVIGDPEYVFLARIAFVVAVLFAVGALMPYILPFLSMTGRDAVFRLGTAAVGDRVGFVERFDERLLAVVDDDAAFDVVATGFQWAEGVLATKSADGTGRLLFSDVIANTAFEIRDGDSRPRRLLHPSGYHGTDTLVEPGSNGLLLDRDGLLVACEHGNRRVVRYEANGTLTVLADEWQGNRLNSPNDLIELPGGDLLFTDPPYGLEPLKEDHPERDLDFNGIFRVPIGADRTPGPIEAFRHPSLARPNGIAAVPDSGRLIVADSGTKSLHLLRIDSDGGLRYLSEWYTQDPRTDGLPGTTDGLAIARDGTVLTSGRGGVHVLAPDGTLLGVLHTGRRTANVAVDESGRVFVAADDLVLAIRLRVRPTAPVREMRSALPPLREEHDEL